MIIIKMSCWIIKPLMKMHALQYGNPQNLYGKDSLIQRLFLHRHFHGLISMKVHCGQNVRLVVMEFHRFGTPILPIESFLSEFDSSNGQFDSVFYEVDSSFCEVVSSTCQFDLSAGLFDSSFYEFDSSLTTSVRRRLSFCRFDLSFRRFYVSFHRFDVSFRLVHSARL